MPYDKLEEPKNGKKIQLSGGKIQVPDNPIIPFIEGDGIGRDITKATQRVVNAAVEKIYGGKKKIEWLEINRKYSLAEMKSIWKNVMSYSKLHTGFHSRNSS